MRERRRAGGRGNERGGERSPQVEREREGKEGRRDGKGER